MFLGFHISINHHFSEEVVHQVDFILIVPNFKIDCLFLSLRQRILWCIRRIESIFLSIPFVFVYQSPDCNSIPNSTNRFRWLRWCRSCRCTLILLLLLLSFSISFLLFYRLIWLKVMCHHSMSYGLLNHIILCNLTS